MHVRNNETHALERNNITNSTVDGKIVKRKTLVSYVGESRSRLNQNSQTSSLATVKDPDENSGSMGKVKAFKLQVRKRKVVNKRQEYNFWSCLKNIIIRVLGFTLFTFTISEQTSPLWRALTVTSKLSLLDVISFCLREPRKVMTSCCPRV